MLIYLLQLQIIIIFPWTVFLFVSNQISEKRLKSKYQPAKQSVELILYKTYNNNYTIQSIKIVPLINCKHWYLTSMVLDYYSIFEFIYSIRIFTIVWKKIN